VPVHLAGEHARELELGDPPLERAGVALKLGEAGLVRVGLDQVEQLARLADAARDAVELVDRVGEASPFPAELLGPVGRVPDAGVLELAVQLFQALALAVVLKGTPSARPGAARGP
jgi:hypothetical protein